MDQKELRALEARCIQEEPQPCKAGCPLRVDARSFVMAVAAGNLVKGRQVLEKSMPLSGIVGRICEAPCEQYCNRKDLGGSISIRRLERACVEAVPSKTKILRLPLRSQKITVIGGGPSSLTVAFDLTKKGYSVILFHSDSTPGGWLSSLHEDILPLKIIEEEWNRLEKIGVIFRPLAELTDQDCEIADSVYVGFDDELPGAFLELQTKVEQLTFAIFEKDWFGGGLSAEDDQYRFITDVSQGREAAVSLDRYLQGASLTASRAPLRNGHTNLFTNISDVESFAKIHPAGNDGYTREEAVEEAARCIDCQCLECVKNCVYLKEYKAYPKTYARRIYNNSAIVKGSHQANKLINSCSLCGQCEQICPNDFSMAQLCLEARRTMVRENRMPPSAHWFALEEMKSARDEGVLFFQQNSGSSLRVFYPGCQLGGIRPEQTLHLYDALVEQNADTGIWLDCCGAPAHWAGRELEFKEITEQIKTQWMTNGQPEIVMACSSCLKMFRDFLPEISVQSVWSILAEIKLPQCEKFIDYAVSDPCTARFDNETQNDVRQILTQLGIKQSVLTMSGELTECCGFGGLMENANAGLVKKVTQSRTAQSNTTLVTYCAMCRDQLAKNGKPVAHILDLIFPDIAHPTDEKPQSISNRRINRRILKKKLQTRCCPSQILEQAPWELIELNILPFVADVMEERRILKDDIQQVLYSAEEIGSWFEHGENGSSTAYLKLGAVTFWVLYKKVGKQYHIENCWSHRMIIQGGPL